MEDKYAPLRLRNQLCYPLYLCSKEITRLYQPYLSELDLTYTQYIVMMYFWEIKESSEKELSRTLMIDPSTLTPVLKKLEKKEYLAKTRDEIDERRNIIRLTEKGENLQETALSIPGKIGCCVGLSEEEAFALGKLIGKILTNIERN